MDFIALRLKLLITFCLLLGPVAPYDVAGPRWVKEGGQVTLTCPNPFHGFSDLHSVSWSFRGKHFFSYYFNSTSSTQSSLTAPRRRHSPKEFIVDEQASTGLSVHLRNISWGAPGYVQCQLITGPPAYEKKDINTRLNIYRAPSPGPRLHRPQRIYRPGQLAAVTCEMGPGKPAPQLNLFVNGEDVSSEPWGLSVMRGTDRSSGLTYIQLYFNLTSDYVRDGQVMVSCEASLEDVYRLSDHITLSTYASYGGGTEARANLFAASGAAKCAGITCAVLVAVCVVLAWLGSYLGLY